MPDSLHALLAARLDALDPGVRRLVTDAAVLGASFPAEALIAVSQQDEPTVRVALAELVHREVLAVSADPLSPERGSYQFAQQMLRQVAYDTLSRRDRKTRHLAVAAHLRAAFAGDGEEVADVIARHYLDALTAAPEDHDAERIRGASRRRPDPGRRTRRTHRRPGPGRHQLRQRRRTDPGCRTRTASRPRGRLWERAAQAAVDAGDYAPAVGYADRARETYLQCGQARAAARVQAVAGQALRLWGHIAEARDQLTARWRCSAPIRTGTRSARSTSSRPSRCSPAHPTPTSCPPRRSPWARTWTSTRACSAACSGPAGSSWAWPGGARRRSRTSRRARAWPPRPATTSAWDAR